MRNLTYKKIIFSGLLLLGIMGCKKFVTIDPPVSELVTTNVFNNTSTATAAQTAVYAQMASQDNYPYTIEQHSALSSDEFKCYSTDIGTLSLYDNALTAATNPPGEWTTAYSYIYKENAVIAGLQNNTAITTAVSQQLTGEAYFMRAWWYFYLVNLYGDVPLVLTTNPATNSLLSRTAETQVYQQIIADLKNAQNLLNNNYVDATDVTVTTDRVRPNKAAAAALLARVYLYNGNLTGDASNYTNAATTASTVISNSMYSLVTLNSVFLKNSSEAIFQLLPSTSNGYTPEGAFFILTGAPATGTTVNSTLSDSLLNAFEPGDQRKANWVGSVTAGGTTYYFPYKYKLGQAAPAPSGEYVMMLRLGEQYLIRAEAEANGAPGNAVADLNIIRNRAGLPNYAGPTDKASLLKAILKERRVELFTEGHRWFDLKRTGNLNAVMQVATPLKANAPWNPNQALYPIPYTDIQTGINLKQNPGY